MAFEGFTSFTEDLAVANTFLDAHEITATPQEVINVFIAGDNTQASVVTDSFQVRVLVARDDTPTDYIDIPIFATSHEPATVNKTWIAFSLVGYKHYKIQWRSSGTTDTYDMNGEFRGDGVDA